MRIFCCILLTASVVLVGAAEARTPNPRDAAWFHNRPGITLEQYGADSRACADFAAQMVGGDAGANYGLVGIAIAGALAGGNAASFFDDCMIARGYRRFDVAGEPLRAFGQRFAAMTEERRAALISADTPEEGVIARRPSNNTWLGVEGEPAVELRGYAATSERMALPMVALRELEDATPGPNDGVIFASIRSPTADLAAAVFVRVDPATGRPAMVQDGRRERLPLFMLRTRSREPNAPKVLVAPAGTYALVDLDMLMVCLGTIAFTVEPGGVVNLGVVTVNEDPTSAPDPLGGMPMRQVRIDPASAEMLRAALPPELAARAAPASFVNGVRYPCNNAFPWAATSVAMPGAPYYAPPTEAAP